MEGWNATTVENLTEENDLYDTFLRGSRFWIQRVLLPLVVSVGVIGNAVTVVVLTRRRMRSSTNTYLTALAISDLLYLVFVFTLSLEHYPGSHTLSFYYYWLYYRFGLWLTDATTCVSTWLTVTFTVERYIAVCHPMRGKIMCTESRARIAIFIVYLLCFLSTITTPMEWQMDLREIKLSTGEESVYVGQRPTKLGVDIRYTTIFYWFWSITFVFLPLLLLGVFNSFLILAVHKSRRNRCKMTQTDRATSTQKQENKITVTLIAVVILFFFCQLPTAILLILMSVRSTPGNSNTDKLYRALGNIFNFLVTINAASNFLLYCAFSARYRKTLVATFLGRCYGATVPPLLSVTTIPPETSHFVRAYVLHDVVAVVAICFAIVLFMIGLILNITLSVMNANIVLIHFIANHISVGFKGLIIAGLLGIAVPTADSHINYASALCTHDIVRKMVNITEKQALLAARMFTFFICILSIFLTASAKRLFTIELFIINCWDPLIIIPLITAFLKFRTNSKSFITTLTVAVLFTSISRYIVGGSDIISLVYGNCNHWQLYQTTLNSSTQSL